MAGFEQDKFKRTRKVAIALLAVAAIGTGAAAYLVARPPGAQETRQFAAEVTTQTGGECNSNEDCDDGKACTVDICDNGTCNFIESCLGGASCNEQGECELPGQETVTDTGTTPSGGQADTAPIRSLNFVIEMSYKTDQSNDDILVQILEGGEVTSEGVLSSGEDGTTDGLDISSLEDGSYEIRVKPSGYLAQGVSVSIAEGENLVTFTREFIAGDMTTSAEKEEQGFNVISAKDILYIQSKYSTDDALADLDGNGVVSARDLVLAQNNLGKVGD